MQREKIGEKIKSLRLKMRISQYELARRTGIRRGYILKIEKVRGNISIEQLDKIVSCMDHEMQINFLPSRDLEKT